MKRQQVLQIELWNLKTAKVKKELALEEFTNQIELQTAEAEKIRMLFSN